MTSSAKLVVTVFVAVLTGCGTTPVESEPVQREDSGLYFNGGRWPLAHDTAGLGSGRGADIPVCYDFPDLYGDETNHWDADARNAFLSSVQNYIANTWSRIADINTAGWTECSGSSAGMVMTHITNSSACPADVIRPPTARPRLPRSRRR